MLSFFRLEQIKHDLHSEQPEVRGSAMQRLHLWAKKDHGIHSAALPIFRAAVESEQDPWTATTAAAGIATIAGQAEGRSALYALLNHARPEMVARVALSLTEIADIPLLIELLQKRPELLIRTAALRALGSLQDPLALPALLACLASPDLRGHAIQALADLGDPQAIPSLEPYQNDTTELWEEDNHGPMVRVCDLANSTIQHLRLYPNLKQ